MKAVGEFLESDDRTLVCTHATFRFAVDELGIEAFDDCLIAVDEFHHVSANPDNRLGSQLGQFMARDRAHLVAMTGSYFRGDTVAVLAPEDEARFSTVTYTYYEQLNGYTYLKSLQIGYSFYTGPYVESLPKVLDPSLKTILHIPSVMSRESLKDKVKEVEQIMNWLGEWRGTDEVTGFDLIERDGRVLRVANLVDDTSPVARSKVLNALKDPAQRNNRDHVDIIIALGMAKEGFDWIWCEHALTVGYRNSLTEIVQIIGRATRDAPGKETTRFTNLIAEPDATEALVVDAINDTIKAIAASLLMEQVLTPKFEFTPKSAGARDGFDYGDGGYQEGKSNVGINNKTGQVHVEVGGLVEPKSAEAQQIVAEDLNELIATFVQDKAIVERGLFDPEGTIPEELNIVAMGKLIREKYPTLDEHDVEAVRQQAVAALAMVQGTKAVIGQGTPGAGPATPAQRNLALIEGIRKLSLDVRFLEIDMIDRVNPFSAAYAVLAKNLNEDTLRQVHASIAAKRQQISPEDARMYAERALAFRNERGRLPDVNAADPWEQQMALGVQALARYTAAEKARQSKEVPSVEAD